MRVCSRSAPARWSDREPLRGTITGGQLVDAFPLSDLGALVEARTLFVQPVFLNSSRGEVVMGAPQPVTLLDAAS